MKTTARIVLIGALGLGLGLGLWHMTNLGYFQPWEKIYPQSHDLLNYLKVPPDTGPQSPIRFYKPCNYSKPEFSPVVQAPRGTVDCLQRADFRPDGLRRTTYALDSAGIVWRWSHSSSSLSSRSGLLFSGFGLLIGVAVALLIKGLKMYPSGSRTPSR